MKEITLLTIVVASISLLAAACAAPQAAAPVTSVPAAVAENTALGPAVTDVPVAPTGTPAPSPAAGPTPLPPADLTITTGINVCSLEGNKIRGHKFAFNWLAEDRNSPGYAVVFLTLDKGKTFEDLKAWRSTSQPPWTTLINEWETDSGTRRHVETYTIDGPLFIGCFSGKPGDARLEGVAGPIEIIE